jgi:hypothetical protein
MITSLGWWFVLVPLVFVAIAGALSAMAGREFIFRSGTVNGVIGRMGSGKSLFVTARVLVPAARAIHNGTLKCIDTGRPVRRIITNADFYPEVFGYDRCEVVRIYPEDGNLFDQVLALRETVDGEVRLDAIFWVDECHVFMPGGNVRLSAEADLALSHFRKWNAIMMWATQHQMKVNATLRRDTDLIWLPSRVENLLTKIIFGRRSSWFVADAYPSELIDRARSTIGGVRVEERRFFRLTAQMKQAYRSYQTIARDPSTPTLVEPLEQDTDAA